MYITFYITKYLCCSLGIYGRQEKKWLFVKKHDYFCDRFAWWADCLVFTPQPPTLPGWGDKHSGIGLHPLPVVVRPLNPLHVLPGLCLMNRPIKKRMGL